MLTDYDYTNDYTNDAGGAPETWGSEAGHGVLSGRQMLAWVEANCHESCPGAASVATQEKPTAGNKYSLENMKLRFPQNC